jgi:hypothetical protein
MWVECILTQYCESLLQGTAPVELPVAVLEMTGASASERVNKEMTPDLCLFICFLFERLGSAEGGPYKQSQTFRCKKKIKAGSTIVYLPYLRYFLLNTSQNQ